MFSSVGRVQHDRALCNTRDHWMAVLLLICSARCSRFENVLARRQVRSSDTRRPSTHDAGTILLSEALAYTHTQTRVKYIYMHSLKYYEMLRASKYLRVARRECCFGDFVAHCHLQHTTHDSTCMLHRSAISVLEFLV